MPVTNRNRISTATTSMPLRPLCEMSSAVRTVIRPMNSSAMTSTTTRMLDSSFEVQASPTGAPTAMIRQGWDSSPVRAIVQRSVKLVARDRLPASTAVVSRSSR